MKRIHVGDIICDSYNLLLVIGEEESNISSMGKSVVCKWIRKNDLSESNYVHELGDIITYSRFFVQYSKWIRKINQ